MFKDWEDWDNEIFLEFDAEGAPNDEDEEEDFSMDDEESGEEAQSAEEPPADEGNETEGDDGEEDFSMDDDEAGQPEAQSNDGEDNPPAEDDGEEDFSMDDEGGEEPQSAEEPPADNEGEENYEIPDDEGGEEGNNDAPPADDGEEDFSMDDDSEGGYITQGEQPADNQSTGDTQEEPSEDEETNTKLKELESVVFDDLTEEEKNMKITELKALYITVYKKCGTISEMLAGVKKDEETIQIVEYISNTLIDLKEYVNDYINKVFDSKTYVENLAQLQKYIMIFNAINKVFEQIKTENEE